MNTEEIARVCHEANRALTQILQDVPVQPGWDEVDADMKESCVRGVRYALTHPEASPKEQHDEWCKERKAQGWTYGAQKDPVAKTHPALVRYDELPAGGQQKDAVFQAIIRALK